MLILGFLIVKAICKMKSLRSRRSSGSMDDKQDQHYKWISAPQIKCHRAMRCFLNCIIPLNMCVLHTAHCTLNIEYSTLETTYCTPPAHCTQHCAPVDQSAEHVRSACYRWLGFIKQHIALHCTSLYCTELPIKALNCAVVYYTKARFVMSKRHATGENITELEQEI